MMQYIDHIKKRGGLLNISVHMLQRGNEGLTHRLIYVESSGIVSGSLGQDYIVFVCMV